MTFGCELRSELCDGSIEIVLFSEVGVVEFSADVGIHKGLKNVEPRNGVGEVGFAYFVVDHEVAREKEGNANIVLGCVVECDFDSL